MPNEFYKIVCSWILKLLSISRGEKDRKDNHCLSICYILIQDSLPLAVGTSKPHSPLLGCIVLWFTGCWTSFLASTHRPVVPLTGGRGRATRKISQFFKTFPDVFWVGLKESTLALFRITTLVSGNAMTCTKQSRKK